MALLHPFRAWRFTDIQANAPLANRITPDWPMPAGISIAQLTANESQSDDRSKFVRYARSSALWAEWQRSGMVVRDDQKAFHILEVEGHRWLMGVMELGQESQNLRTLQVPPPAHREHKQRLLEATQMYYEPIVVVGNLSSPLKSLTDSGECLIPAEEALTFEEGFLVEENSDLADAAYAFQSDMARVGKIRPSDHALVAIDLADQVAEPSYLAFQKLPVDFESLPKLLNDIGFRQTTRQEVPNELQVFLPGSEVSFTYNHVGVESGPIWRELQRVLSLRSINLNLQTRNLVEAEASMSDTTGIVIRMPKIPISLMSPYVGSPLGSFAVAKVPSAGAIMWSLRDF